MGKAIARVAAITCLLAVSVGLGAGRAGAVLPAHPAPCAWSFGAFSTQGALGTLVLQVELTPASPTMSCLQTVAMTSEVTNASGGVPAGIGNDGGTASVVLLFTRGEDRAPTVLVGWAGYCTQVAQPVYLHLTGGGMTAVYSLGESRPCSQGPATTSFVESPRVNSPDPTVGLAPAPSGGYRIATADGSVLRQPGAVVEAGDGASNPFVGIAPAPDGGFWLATSGGGVYAYNGAGFYGSASSLHLAAPIVGIAPTPSGHGYWLAAADGGVFAFGDAHFYGSAGNLHLAAPVTGIARTVDGGGYWLAAADGGVFNYGDGHFFGSAGAVQLSAPVIGMAADDTTGGYWLAAADGGVFAYHATFDGSAGGLDLQAPMTAIAATPDSGGYWLLGGDGGVFAFGNAPYHGTGGSLVEP